MATTFPDDADGHALKGLAEAGIDLAQPIDVEFTIDVRDETSGSKLQAELALAGYSLELDYDEGEEVDDEGIETEEVEEEFGPSWTLYAKISIVPSYTEIVERQRSINFIAKKYSAICDGWGVQV